MDAIIEAVVTLVVALVQLAIQGAVLVIELLAVVVEAVWGLFSRRAGVERGDK